MSRLARFCAVAIVGLSLPFSAWGLGTNDLGTSDDGAPGLSVWDAGEQAVFELPPGVAPPECKLKNQDSKAGEGDAHPAACCWFFYFGRYWCVPC